MKGKFYVVFFCVFERGNIEFLRSYFRDKLKLCWGVRRNEILGSYLIKILGLWGDKRYGKDRVDLVCGLYFNILMFRVEKN